jgi:hypothetical protein
MLLVQIQPHPVQTRVLTRIEAQQSIRILLDNLCSRWRSVSARTKIKIQLIAGMMIPPRNAITI